MKICHPAKTVADRFKYRNKNEGVSSLSYALPIHAVQELLSRRGGKAYR